jgi:phage tail-like protein
MTGASTFRLLDERVGWDPRPGDGLSGVAATPGGLRLAPLPGPGTTEALTARLVPGGGGVWWLGTRTGIHRLGPCDSAFRAYRRTAGARGLAVRGRLVAELTRSGTVLVLDTPSNTVVGEGRVAGGRTVRFAPGGPVVTDEHGRVTAFDPSGLPHRRVPGPPPPPVTLPPGVTVFRDGFRIEGRGAFDLRGRRVAEADLGPAPATTEGRGQYLSLPLDSGRPGCRWHRIRVDAAVPAGTSLEVAFATTDGSPVGRTAAAPDAGGWSGFPGGDPDPLDWFSLAPGVTDSTLRSAPGRYGYLRLRLTGDGSATPVVGQVRLDLPRSTSLAWLPAVYAQDPPAADFTERFLSLFDAHLEELDEVLDRRGALLDAAALPDAALGWLGGLIGTGFETSMPAARRRALLAAAPDLYRQRGTPGAIADTLRIALGVDAAIEELGTHRPWGAVGAARLGSVRLFGSSRVRVRLGRSRLGGAVLNATGNPDDDAVLAGAHRIRVHVRPGSDGPVDVALVERVVRSQSPAHLAATVRVARPGFVAGLLHAGVDTALLAPDPAVLSRVVLGRAGVLRRGRTPAAVTVAGPIHVVGAGRRPAKGMTG